MLLSCHAAGHKWVDGLTKLPGWLAVTVDLNGPQCVSGALTQLSLSQLENARYTTN